MNSFKHVFYSWSLSIAITLLGLFIYFLMDRPSYFHGDFYNVWQLGILFGASFIIALPSLPFSYLMLRLISITSYTLYEKYALWFIAAFVAVLLNILFIGVLFLQDLMKLDIFFELWPAYAGLAISLSFRYQYFIQLFTVNTVNEKFTEENHDKI